MLSYAFEIRESWKFSRIPEDLLNSAEHKITINSINYIPLMEIIID